NVEQKSEPKKSNDTYLVLRHQPRRSSTMTCRAFNIHGGFDFSPRIATLVSYLILCPFFGLYIALLWLRSDVVCCVLSALLFFTLLFAGA
ncbi:UNVERIFIED_CONTAM: hypothetical protein Sradi_7278800, partial [Sesamum radiatum]